MRCLILSDIHSNLQALEAVLKDAAGAYDAVVCLGDVVGYAADPNAVTDWVRTHVLAIVRGNHDRACTGDPVIDFFGDSAREAAIWTQSTLTDQNRTYLQGLPKGPRLFAGFSLSHGSPRDEDEYVITKSEALDVFLHLPAEVCFFGHTHLQIGFGLRRGRAWVLPPPDLDASQQSYQLEPDAWYLLNPGSVGQPRDADPRAAYALYDTESRLLVLRRVNYDIALAQSRIRQAGLPEYLAHRLAAGH